MNLTGTAAGVPYVALPPAGGPRPDAPVVVAYHLLDEPSDEQKFARTVPLDGLDAWRIYFGLPMSGRRAPAGGPDELWRLLAQDAVLQVHQHVTLGALKEFPDAYATVRSRFGIADDVPVGVMGGSMGGAVAQLVLAEGGVHARAAVLINPVVKLKDSIDALSRKHGTPYTWTPESEAVADRVDFVRRAHEIDHAAIRFITGADDMVDAILTPVDEAMTKLTADRRIVPGMGHAITDARTVDRLAAEWFRRHLPTEPADRLRPR